jgi:hypothetical protein
MRNLEGSKGRVDQFTKSSANGRYLRRAVIVDRGLDVVASAASNSFASGDLRHFARRSEALESWRENGEASAGRAVNW